MNLPHDLPLPQRLARAWPPPQWQDVNVLVAVSGGADSVALLRALAELHPGGRGRLLVGHFNHRLRGGESDADQQFVAELCGRLGVAFLCASAEGDAAEPRQGLEASLRRQRYRFLQQAAEESAARYVATAHTADDQVETILHRLLRGTGIGGLRGIPRVRPLGAAMLIRPLLGFRRQELRAYLEVLGQPFREDASNRDLRRTRNRLRHELLPRLSEDFNPAVHRALLRLAGQAGDMQAAIDWAVQRELDTRLSPCDGGYCLDLHQAAQLPPHLLRELFVALWKHAHWPRQAMTDAHWRRLADLARHGGKQVFPGKIVAEADGRRMQLHAASGEC